MLNLILFGPPGAGKGTQSANLIKKYGLIHLSTGDIFRSNISQGTELGNLAKEYSNKGILVPDSLTIQMLESEIEKYPNAKGFIFDGFPRTTAQAEALDLFLKNKNQTISKMLALEVSEKELKKRLLNRGKDSGRPDDQNPEIIQKRIDEYNAKTLPLKSYYEKQLKYVGVSGIGSIDKIFLALCRIIDSLNKTQKTQAKSSKTKIPTQVNTEIKSNEVSTVETPATTTPKKAGRPKGSKNKTKSKSKKTTRKNAKKNPVGRPKKKKVGRPSKKRPVGRPRKKKVGRPTKKRPVGRPAKKQVGRPAKKRPVGRPSKKKISNPFPLKSTSKKVAKKARKK